MEGDRGEKVVVGVVAGAVGMGIGTLLAGRPAAAASPDEKLVYITDCLEKIVQLLGQQIEPNGLGEGLPLEKLLTLTRGQFLSDPEGVLALINSNQPNLCRAALMNMVVTLGPGATTTITSDVLEGFVHVVTYIELYTDVPFATAILMLRDGQIWYQDPGLVPLSARIRNWQEATYRWDVTLINTSALTVNLHIAWAGWDIETETLRNIKNILVPLSYAVSEHGTPEGRT